MNSSRYLKYKTSAPVINKFKIDNGKRNFHPYDINWSYLKRGNEARSKMKIIMKANILIKNQTTGGRKSNPSHPPKNKAVINDEINVIPKYSPTKNNPNFIPEYSE